MTNEEKQALKNLQNTSLNDITQNLKKNKRIFKLKKNFSYKEFNNFLKEGFIQGYTTKILFADSETYKYLQKLLMQYLFKKDKKNIKYYIHFVSVFGIANIIEKSNITKTICLIDMNKIKHIKYHLIGIIN